jgi:hypothetical protein
VLSVAGDGLRWHNIHAGFMTIGTGVPKVSEREYKYMSTHRKQRYFISLLSFQNGESRAEIKTLNLK